MKFDPTNYPALPAREVFKGFHGQFVHTGSMTIAYWKVDAGSAVPEHHHVHEQVVQMISGDFELTVAGQTYRLKPGDVVAIPSDVPHSARSISDCVLHDIFIPERDDYK